MKGVYSQHILTQFGENLGNFIEDIITISSLKLVNICVVPPLILAIICDRVFDGDRVKFSLKIRIKKEGIGEAIAPRYILDAMGIRAIKSTRQQIEHIPNIANKSIRDRRSLNPARFYLDLLLLNHPAKQ